MDNNGIKETKQTVVIDAMDHILKYAHGMNAGSGHQGSRPSRKFKINLDAGTYLHREFTVL
eukprot:SAG31_NODE_272_length_18690_cov_14.520785_15_plen_61_part_00